jgi:hypothetical protein
VIDHPTHAHACAAYLVMLASEGAPDGALADRLLVAATEHNHHAGDTGAQFVLDVAETVARIAAAFASQLGEE